MRFAKEGNALIAKRQGETLRIEPWGTNALRVRSTVNREFTGEVHGLTEEVLKNGEVRIAEDGQSAEITNGRIKATVNEVGIITFYRDDKRVLREYYSFYGGSLSKESICFKIVSREFKGLASDDYKLTVRFESSPEEQFFGMGQYQQPMLDLKGTVLELAQRNSQVSVPFLVSSYNYGLLWNNPAVGEAVLGRNQYKFIAEETAEMDYWITADEDPKALVRNYTEAVGRAPILSDEYLGLWQCKLRYRTPEEVLEVARKYKELGIHLDVIVIDFFHWPYQGDWRFDETYWPEAKVRAMCDELHEMGTKVMVSVWPSVDKRSENFWFMQENGLLSRTEKGSPQTYDYQGDCGTIDMFHPEARSFIWEKCRKNYQDWGIDLFWLDNCEPDSVVYDFDNLRYFTGRGSKVGNEYPKMYLKAFYDGLTESGKKDFILLIRSAWVGSQKYRPLVWTGDVQSTYEGFRDQVIAGQNMGLAGIPWWTTDIGGFMTEDVNDPKFKELLIRWYQYGVFCPIFRMHGDRGPYDIPPLDNRDFGGGYLHTGQPNEIWSYGEECFEIMKKYLDLRLSLKDYIAGLMKEAHENGSPLIRTMFYEFPEDPECWKREDQYMFGPDYLVAPVLEAGATSREVYLPRGTSWKNLHTGEVLSGGQAICADAPIEIIPVYIRC
ncbi:MAG: glycoside hydrolase family 31 protein [Lachnospiraceae bacterium]|nr:glycoside hydrolase family 31 protein [Lachnospiraceae bacterium]